ncbi:MAG: MBL fold metallo-hydrolase [Muribaculaceae bacterium]|nr:MBL fold metallo-hydrolase [Muribaculaceae bacterium]
MHKQITEHVEWVGKVDWELKHFHGDELSTSRGSSYNAYLLRAGGKTVLIDTVWRPYDHEFLDSLKETVDIRTIDYIVMNHSEIDHSGALPLIMKEIPGTPVYCTAKGRDIILGHHHEAADWNFRIVHTGERLELGDRSLTFIEAPFLHWPDTMFSYFDGDGGVLFSTDAFGQHFATESLFDDAEEDLPAAFDEAMKYYANILAPFNPLVSKKVAELLGMNLPIAVIAPSHGIIWRSHIPEIIERYQKWSKPYAEDRVTVVYDTMWDSTRRMAEALADGIRAAHPETTVVIRNAAKDDKNDILTDIFRSRAVVMGCPTINNELSYAIDGLLGMIKGLKLKGKRCLTFGSYGWSGEGPKLIAERLKVAGFEPVGEPLRQQWVPTPEDLAALRSTPVLAEL